MGAISKEKKILSPEEILIRIQKSKEKFIIKRWFVIYHSLIKDTTAENIAKDTKYAVQTVHNLISRYNKHGIEAIETIGRKHLRPYAYLSVEKEKEILNKFLEKAKKGLITTAKEIKKAFECEIGHSIDESTIYRILKKHNWNKKVARPKHKKSDHKKQEEFKKNLIQI